MVGAKPGERRGNPWERWVHKHDHTVIYEAREADGVYEARRPGEEEPSIWAPKAAWKEIYQREEEDG